MLSQFACHQNRYAYFLPLTYYSGLSSAFNRRVQRTALIYSLLPPFLMVVVSTVLCSTYCRPPLWLCSLPDFLVLRPESQTYYRCTISMPLNFYYLATTINEIPFALPPSTREAPPLIVVPFWYPLYKRPDCHSRLSYLWKSPVMNWLSATVNGCIISLPHKLLWLPISWYPPDSIRLPLEPRHEHSAGHGW